MTHLLDIFQTQGAHYGFSCLGAFITALAFHFFPKKTMQYLRFHLIGRGFFILCFSDLLLLLAMGLHLLNPAMSPSEDVLQFITSLLYALACGHFLASLFINLSELLLFLVFPIISVTVFVSLQYAFIRFDLTILHAQQLSSLLVGITLSVAAFGFHTIPSVAQKMLFRMPKIGLLILGAYFILDAFWPSPLPQTIPMILYALVTTFVLAAQLRFATYTAQKYQSAFEEEQKHKTLLLDMAPFPVLLARLMDDSVVYMNAPCQKILGINSDQIKSLRFSEFFSTPQKRDELIEQTKSAQFVESFDVELNVQNSDHNTLWITLSSRIFEMDGELLLYINFTNITDQKETEQALFVQASTDALTGLYNRRQFLTLTKQALALSQREKTPFCVLMLDIDHFKNINDTYGHDVGDVVLKHLAETMQNTLRQSDIIARWGGEEFIVFLHNTLPEKALTPANKLRQAVQDLTLTIDGNSIAFTISVGVSSDQILDILSLQKEADIALYHSKESGRNQTTLYTPDLTMPDTQQGQG